MCRCVVVVTWDKSRYTHVRIRSNFCHPAYNFCLSSFVPLAVCFFTCFCSTVRLLQLFVYQIIVFIHVRACNPSFLANRRPRHQREISSNLNSSHEIPHSVVLPLRSQVPGNIDSCGGSKPAVSWQKFLWKDSSARKALRSSRKFKLNLN